MLAAERRKHIIALLTTEKRVYVGELSARFDVSEETIRRDLELLEEKGIAARTYGGAILAEDEHRETPFEIRKKESIAAKVTIARLVAPLINDGDYLLIDESSTSYYIARELKSKNNLTIITNSMEIITELSDMQSWNIFCTGGEFRKSAPAFAGHQAENMVRSYHVDKAIISCGSLDKLAGLTDRHEDTALLKRAMMSSARQVMLAVDHSKFDKVAFATIGKLKELDTIITDAEPNQAWKETLEANGIELIY